MGKITEEMADKLARILFTDGKEIYNIKNKWREAGLIEETALEKAAKKICENCIKNTDCVHWIDYDGSCKIIRDAINQVIKELKGE